MKKMTVSALCLLALLANGWLVATHFMQSRIERGISQLIAAVPLLAQATHGPVTVNLWDRSIYIPDVVIAPGGAEDGAKTTIASISAFDVDSSGGLLTVARVVINDARSWRRPWSQLPSNSMSRALYLLPTATIEGIAFRANSPNSLMGELTVTSVSVPELKTSTILQSKTLIDEAHTNINVSAVRDGKIGIVRVGHSAITTSLIGENPLLLEINDLNFGDLDLGLIASLFDSATPTASGSIRYKPVLRYGSTGAITVYRDGVVAATCASLELSSVAIDLSRSGTAVGALKAAQPTAGQRLTRKQEQAMQDAVVTLYENVAADWFKMNGLTWAPGALPVGRGQGSIATLQMHDLIDGKIARLHITGLDAITFPDTPSFSPSHDSLVVGRSTFQNLNLVELTRLPARLVTSSMKLPPATTLWPLAIRLFDGIDAEKVFITTGLQRDGMGIDQLTAAWGPVIGQTPTSGHVRARFSLPIDYAEISVFGRTGLRNAAFNLDGRWRWLETAKTMDFGPLEIVIAGIGSARTTLQLTNVTRMALIARPDLMPAAIQAITLGPVDITLRDQGLLKLLGNDPNFAAQRQRTIARAQVLIGGDGHSAPLVKASEQAVAHNWVAFADRVAEFLAQPSQQLTLTLTPMAVLSLGSMLSSGTSGDDFVRRLVTQIDTRASVK
jgi:hypothetical protein